MFPPHRYCEVIGSDSLTRHSCSWVSSIFGTDCWNAQKKTNHDYMQQKESFLVGGFDPSDKKTSQIGNLPPKERWTHLKNIWNHHLQVVMFQYHPHIPPSFFPPGRPMVGSRPLPSRLNWKWYATSTGKVSDLGPSSPGSARMSRDGRLGSRGKFSSTKIGLVVSTQPNWNNII